MLNFPNAPTPGQTYNAGGATWLWDGSKWGTGAPALNDVVNSASVGNTGRNLVHNGRFEVQQRGQGPWTTVNAFTADRWSLWLSGADTVSTTISAIGDTQRAQIGDESAAWQLNSGVTGTAAGNVVLTHKIENVRRLSGKTVTVSFYAAGSASATRLGVSLDQFFGAGGSPSGTVNGIGQVATISPTSWARYSMTFTLPSTAGKTLGTNGGDCTLLNFWLSCGASSSSYAYSGNLGAQTGSLYLWGVQLEVGSVATPLAKRDIADELALCQRFYQTAQPFVQGYTSNSATVGAGVTFAVMLRAAPTLAIVDSSGNTGVGAASVGGNSRFAFVNAVANASTNYTLNTVISASADL